MSPNIPRQIHYCWFGGGDLGEKELSCIESWRKFLPDYEIIRWDETNFNVSCCDYVREAYDAGKWAFVSDYARFKILYECGGVYFDTDVKVIKPLSDILANGAFMGIETDCSDVSQSEGAAQIPMVNPGVGLAAPAGLRVFGEILERYEKDHFVTADGDLNLLTIVDRTTRVLAERGLKAVPGIQSVAGINIYPSEYFCPMDFDSGRLNITDNTRSVHLFGGTWFSRSQRLELRLKRFLIKSGIDKSAASRISAVFATVLCFDIKRVKRGMNKTKTTRACK